MTWTIPNILTVLRLIAAPLLVIVLTLFPPPLADYLALGLFVGAALTDYVDGYLARKLNQMSKFGKMLDPIADKAMVVVAFTALAGLYGLSPLILIPGGLILFREVFVSGLREFLGADAGKLSVTKLAKWKTTVQMVAIAVLLARGIFEHRFGMSTFGMDDALVRSVLAGETPDLHNIRLNLTLTQLCQNGGIALLWLAAALTVITGWDYFIKSLPFLREDPS